MKLESLILHQQRKDMKVQGNTALIIAIVVIAIVSRIIPHYPNFTAMGAVALFGGAYLGRKAAFLVPLAALFVSNLLLNNWIYAEFVDGFQLFNVGSLWIYGAFVLITLLGMGILTKVNPGRFLGASVGAAVIFLLVTNFGVWMSSVAFPKTWTGLIACYTAAIPFFWNTLMGNLAFGAVMFGVYEYIRARQLKKAAESSENA